MTNFGSRLKAVTGNLTKLVEVANACDLAYCLGINNAYGPHVDFGADKPESVAQNQAGLQAVVSGVSCIALLRNILVAPAPIDEQAPVILQDIVESKLSVDGDKLVVEGKLSDVETGMLLRLANCAWGAGQSFRTDKGPLGRATRVNFFDDLPADEVAKDWHQIVAGAKYLLENIS